ncbi:MAG: TonB-dependent receptor, partial [Acidobacteria bacterium]|nr:TonB-dependent receptor [Acidobacteriota bacterium]
MIRKVRLVTGCAALLIAALMATPAAAQSQAANGNIEGVVRDSSGAVLPGVTVTVTNTGTGAQRTVVTNENGAYRAVLLPLGAYTVAAELPGFKRYEQTGLALSAGQTVTIDVAMPIGGVEEVVSVTAENPVVDTAKIDTGRNISEREIKNLPLVSRNPYNYALVQPGVSGFENPEFGVPRFAANGTLLRVNYQIDGNTNTQKDRAGLRLLPVSEVMVQEVKVITSGYAPEFGQTMGLVYNAITPSGTNTFRGSGSYRFRRKDFSAFPYPFTGPRTADRKPDTKIDTWTAEAGGPVLRDRLHFFGGFESTYRDLSGQSTIIITPENAALIGLSPQPSAIPREQTARFYIGKFDYQLGQAHRATARYIRFENDSPNNIGGGLNSTEVSTDFLDAMNSAAFQVVSTFGSNRLNELRVQYANRHQSRSLSSLSGTGPRINIAGVANFGHPNANTSGAGFDFQQNIWQVIDNFTVLRGNHSYKFGFDMQFIEDKRTASLFTVYNFPTPAAYLAARNGTNPFSYSTFQQLFGDPDFRMDTAMYSAFVQDDWRVTPDLKMLYGLRYDLYRYPEGDANAPFEWNRDFRADRNNFGPRLGIAWTPFEDKRTVVRASTGVMYDQPLLAAYELAFQNSGSPSRFTVAVNPSSAGAPAFPGNLANLPPGFALPTQSISTVDPDFKVARTFQNNVQLERGLGRHFAASIGFVHVQGYDLPVITNINLINPTGTLADGRPIFSTAVNANTRRFPQFNQVNAVQSIGDSTYRAMTLQLNKRWSHNYQFDLSYTLGKGEDNAPLTSALSVQGDDARSDPTNLERDRGPNLIDMRHNFAGTIVARSSWTRGPEVLQALLTDNQVGILMQFNSGLPVNVRGNRDLNLDGVANDRPAGVG